LYRLGNTRFILKKMAVETIHGNESKKKTNLENLKRNEKRREEKNYFLLIRIMACSQISIIQGVQGLVPDN